MYLNRWLPRILDSGFNSKYLSALKPTRLWLILYILQDYGLFCTIHPLYLSYNMDPMPHRRSPVLVLPFSVHLSCFVLFQMMAELMFRKHDYESATFNFQQLLERKPGID